MGDILNACACLCACVLKSIGSPVALTKYSKIVSFGFNFG